MNINYLVEEKKKLLDAVLTSYDLSRRVYFPTRFQNNSATAVASILIDTYKFENYIIGYPLCLTGCLTTMHSLLG